MKRIAAALALALCLTVLCGCAGRGTPETTGEPVSSAAPEAEYEMTHIVRYWPEDADYDSCDYACIAEIPMFSKAFTAGYAMNEAVDAYYEALCGRIESEYMPASIARPPYTEIACEVEKTGDITNVIFTEKHCYEAQPQTRKHVLMLDGRGNAINLCDVFLNYRAERMTAAAIAEEISGDPRYYQLDTDGILAFLDINHGAKATDTGCTVFIPEGKLAPYEEGVLEFDFTFDDIAPDFVGENGAMTIEEYRDLTEFLGFVGDGVVVRGDFIENGTLTEYAASSFMGELAQTLGIKPEAGRINVPEEEFLSLYRECFGAEFPGIDVDAHDIRREDGFFKVRYVRKPYRYNVDMLEAFREGGTLRIDGSLYFGDFGYASTEFSCSVSITLERNSASPYGFTLKEFVIH
ncbi:MAG: hypothetical protein IKG85_06170 [Clostridia bacterium]|nr:hypothetical protein [Clostridia bacterium]